jgi:hypothetical protein
MLNTRFHRSVKPLSASTITHLRTRLRCCPSLPASAGTVGQAQGLLLVSLMYGVGATAAEVAAMPIQSLLTNDGLPADEVKFAASMTKHGVARREAMHPDVLRDLLGFRDAYPDQQWVAFATNRDGVALDKQLTPNAITAWFRQCLREAGLVGFSVRSGRKSFRDAQRGQFA